MRSLIRLVPVLVFALVAAACGSDSSTPGGGDTGGTETESESGGESTGAEEYATGLCTAVGDWMDALQAGGQEFQDAASNITSPEDIGGVKDALVAYAGDLVAETDALISEVEALGTPDVEGGQELADGLVAGFQSARDLFAQLEEDASGLDATDPTTMITSMQEMATSLQDGAQEIQTAFEALDSSEMSGLSESVPACSELQTAA